MHNKNYIDITKKWLGEKPPKKNKIKMYDIGDTFTFRCNKYKLDNYYVKYNLSNNEYEFAKWLSNKTKKKIILIPKINYPLGIQTPDFRIGNEYWDLKTLSKENKSKQPIYHAIINKKYQASNFIIDANNSKHSLNFLIQETKSIFNRKDSLWVNSILIRNKNKIVILKRSKTPLVIQQYLTSLTIIY